MYKVLVFDICDLSRGEEKEEEEVAMKKTSMHTT